MISTEAMREGLGASMVGVTGLVAADRLCQACVDLLDVDGAAISLIHQGTSRGTFGSSNDLSRRLDALQFTFGEGPCLDAVQQQRPVLVDDLAVGHRWPAFTGSVLGAGVRAVFALPVAVASEHVGALDLFRHEPRGLEPDGLTGALLAARLATVPILDLISGLSDRAEAGIVEGTQETPWSELESLDRVEIYQATGFLIAQLGISPAEAVVRLRARAFSTDRTASDVAYQILDRSLELDENGEWSESRQDEGGGQEDRDR